MGLDIVNSEGGIQCDKCDKWFDVKNFKKHLVKHSHPCNECDASFSTQTLLQVIKTFTDIGRTVTGHTMCKRAQLFVKKYKTLCRLSANKDNRSLLTITGRPKKDFQPRKYILLSFNKDYHKIMGDIRK